jgi:HEPN domain-containing protein
MTERPDSNKHILQWVDKAEHDLLAAEYMIQSAEGMLSDIVCFHCQQCAEKYLKALLVFLGVAFPKTHDIRLLLDLMPSHISLNLSRERVIPLNRYVIEGRYPGEWEPIALVEAKSALAAAKEVKSAVRSFLPEEIRDLYRQ